MTEKNMRCAFWREGDRCAKFSDDECDNFCVLGPCSAQVPSNADRIRAMSDEELSIFIERSDCPPDDWICEKDDKSCTHCWLEWLLSPVDGVEVTTVKTMHVVPATKILQRIERSVAGDVIL